MASPAVVGNKRRKLLNAVTVNSSTNLPAFPSTGAAVEPQVFAGDFHGAEIIGMEWRAVNGAGTAPTLDGKLQHSRDGITWFDVDATNAKFTQATGAGATATQFVQIPANLQLLPYLRIAFTIGGTNSPSYTVTVWIHFNQWGPKGRLAPPGFAAKLD